MLVGEQAIAEMRADEAGATRDEDLRNRSIYALAYLPIDNWATWEQEYNDEGKLIIKYEEPITDSRRYANLSYLSGYYNDNRQNVPEYISKCDVLRQFNKLKWLNEY